MSNDTVSAVEAAGKDAQYDEKAKRLLSDKNILSYILVKTVPEFKGMSFEQVKSCIEGEPVIGRTPVEPGLTNVADKTGQRIRGLNAEDSEVNEGVIRFDIIFYVRINRDLTKIIINLEAQKTEPSSYGILNRATFYAGRMISSQKSREFSNMNYDDMKQIYTIWVCMRMPVCSLSHIHLVQEDILEKQQWRGRLDLFNIVMIGITEKIPEHSKEYELHRLLSTLFSSVLETEEKLKTLENEFNIPVTDEFRKDVNNMCNLSQGIREDGIKEGIQKGIQKGREEGREEVIRSMAQNGITVEQIAQIVKRSKVDVENILQSVKKTAKDTAHTIQFF